MIWLTACHSTSCRIVLALHQRKVTIAQVINLHINCNGIYHTAAEEHEVRSSLSFTERLRAFSLCFVHWERNFSRAELVCCRLAIMVIFCAGYKGVISSS
jgi:hypothetical protein